MLGSWREQAEVAHGVLIAIHNVLRKQGQKVCGGARAFKDRLRPSVLTLIDDLLGGDAKNAPLGDGKPPDVAARVPQELLLCHLRGDVDVPGALGLSEDQIAKLPRHSG